MLSSHLFRNNTLPEQVQSQSRNPSTPKKARQKRMITSKMQIWSIRINQNHLNSTVYKKH